MKPPPLLPMAERGQMALDVFNAAIGATEVFKEDDIGVHLAYLMGAILDDSDWHDGRSFVDWSADVFDEPPALLAILKEKFPPEHAVWVHIKLETEE